MRQLISRIDNDLHERLKQRAAAEGVSVNALVNRILDHEVQPETARQRTRRRAHERGVLSEQPSRPRSAPSADEVDALTRGWGRVVSEQLQADRQRIR